MPVCIHQKERLWLVEIKNETGKHVDFIFGVFRESIDKNRTSGKYVEVGVHLKYVEVGVHLKYVEVGVHLKKQKVKL